MFRDEFGGVAGVQIISALWAMIKLCWLGHE